ncbi:MAG: lactate utilization protein [Bacteroidetes bacterium]|nr:lactate utilization protein [Bacteroidota bacterium]
MTSSREQILKRVRKATAQAVPIPYPDLGNYTDYFEKTVMDKEIEFAQNFVSLQGRFSFCEDIDELKKQIDTLIKSRNWEKIFCAEKDILLKLKDTLPESLITDSLAECNASLTTCEALVARTGSIVLSSAQELGRTTSIYAPVHICIADTSQIMYDVADVFHFLQKKYKGLLPSSISFASGPSRTADIEKTLVTGVHGPKEVFCFLVQE